MTDFYAILDENSIVVEVFSGKKITDLDSEENKVDWEKYYNAKLTDQNGIYRKNFAGIGYKYDEILDAFIPPQTYPSWLFDEETCTWVPPVPKPEGCTMCQWVEEEKAWIVL